MKFITGLLFENAIPHLDINKNDSTNDEENRNAIHEKILNDKKFHSFFLKGDAYDIANYLNGRYIVIKRERQSLAIKNIFDENEKDEIKKELNELPFIKRLSKVSQLGLKGYWKNATEENNRWEHSKEVAENALSLYDKLHEKRKMEKKESERVLVYLSGLLHDCGHLPFSHLLEDVFFELSWKLGDNDDSFKHNHYTSYLISKIFAEEKSIKKTKKCIDKYRVSVEDILKVINGNYGIGYIDALINSEIDCDKISYLCKDSKHVNMQLLVNNAGEFIEKFVENAYITEEKLIALDSESALIAFRLLDERKRFYNELYFSNDLRYLESVVKYILITYFVQKYNELDADKYKKYGNDNYTDLSHCRIMMAIEDLFEIIDNDDSDIDDKTITMEKSLSKQALKTLRRCMKISLEIFDNEEENEKLGEIKILEFLYKRLTGKNYVFDNHERNMDLSPYVDSEIEILSRQLNYKQLQKIRKRIHLNFPGVLLIDVIKSVNYLSTADSRKRKQRLDGTYENQVIYLVPPEERSTWHNKESIANTDITEYVEKNDTVDHRCKFNVYRLDDDDTLIEFAINMLKKEMKYHIDNKNGGNNE